MIYRRICPLNLTQLLLALMPLLVGTGLSAQSLGSAFTYQGQLKDVGQPANGLYDLQVCLFDGPSNPIPMACAPDFIDVPVEAGLFAITLDFGSAPFVGQQRYLELRVRPGASVAGYTILAPRQVIRPAPEALRSNVAAAAPWSGLTGVPAGFADGVDNESGGTVTSIATGAGLAGGPITGIGTIAIANSGVTSVMIASGAVGTPQLASNAVNSAQIADGTIVAADLAGDSVEATQLAANAVDTAAIVDANVTTAKIAAGAVGGTQINAAEVQVRVNGICPIGEYGRGVNADGSLICRPINTVGDKCTLRTSDYLETGILVSVTDNNGPIPSQLTYLKCDSLADRKWLFNIPGKSSPWMESTNPNYLYLLPDYPDAQGTAPISITLSDYRLREHNRVFLQCMSGTANGGGLPNSGCDGLTSYQPNIAGQPFYKAGSGTTSGSPASYMDASEGLIYDVSLVGVFTDAIGKIIGEPFHISSKQKMFSVPSGATKLQFGFSDGRLGDNFGSLNVQLSY